ncbi:MAG: hypothetical protein IJ419_13840 [Agathobacter sp.]|nr:hypothetical protein [Agathobacter sp.]
MDEKLNKKAKQSYIMQIACILLMTIVIIVAWCYAAEWEKVDDYKYRLISRDNNVNTPQEMHQYLKMTPEEQNELCLDFLKDAESKCNDYNNCRIETTVHGYTYQLIRSGNVAVGTITDDKQWFTIYCEQKEEKTILRLKRNDIWYETSLYNHEVLTIDVEEIINKLKSVQWEYAQTEWSTDSLKPGTENLTWLNSEDYQACFYDCGHLGRYVSPTQDISFYNPGKAYYPMPDFKNATIIPINDISEVFILDTWEGVVEYDSH